MDARLTKSVAQVSKLFRTQEPEIKGFPPILAKLVTHLSKKSSTYEKMEDYSSFLHMAQEDWKTETTSGSMSGKKDHLRGLLVLAVMLALPMTCDDPREILEKIQGTDDSSSALAWYIFGPLNLSPLFLKCTGLKSAFNSHTYFSHCF
jgi:hypothetical protein